MEYDVKPITDVMNTLLGENGCPWDKEQTHDSLRKNLLEEAHEVIEAIDSKDMEHLKEELGDVLLQVVFHAKLAETEGHFNLNDVVQAITDKMIRRHPHIFADVKADDAETVLSNWEEIKKKEKAGKGDKEEPQSVMSKLPPTLPALMKAEKVQQKAHRVGFDWDDAEGPKAKIVEELAEIDAAMKGDGDVEEEIGDLLFSAVNLARFAKVDPEQALNRSVQKFVDRFRAMEAKIVLDKKDFSQYTLEELDKIWDICKEEMKKNQ
ncbi:MAG: nucleoside triphosphate pyrophosphohydrolase [Peptococcaceae bacterium]|nr:nucleoside triphosphate pyrophosphohydrolase [Peptococcaceae bacterium]